MTFQFLCPEGHLLEGDEAHMGMQCQCPQCGTAFIIPTIDGSAGAGQMNAAGEPGEVAIGVEPLEGASDLVSDDALAGMDASEIAASELGAAADADQMLHIPCPNGHELETPVEMIGQRALCPHCGVEFRLRREKSIEYLHQQELLERKRARFWFQLSVMAATFVGFVLLVMLGIMIFS